MESNWITKRTLLLFCDMLKHFLDFLLPISFPLTVAVTLIVIIYSMYNKWRHFILLWTHYIVPHIIFKGHLQFMFWFKYFTRTVYTTQGRLNSYVCLHTKKDQYLMTQYSTTGAYNSLHSFILFPSRAHLFARIAAQSPVCDSLHEIA